MYGNGVKILKKLKILMFRGIKFVPRVKEFP